MYLCVQVGSLAFQPNAWITPTCLGTYYGLATLYYWLYARHHQIVSPEEEVSPTRGLGKGVRKSYPK
jgi:hypothetical protein